MKKLLVVLMLVVIGVVMGCGDSSVRGTFVASKDSLLSGMTIRIEGRKAYGQAAGVEAVWKYEVLDMMDKKTGEKFRAIRFEHEQTGQAFYGKILSTDSSGKVKSFYANLLVASGTFVREEN